MHPETRPDTQPESRDAFLTQLVATPAGRAHLLSISVEAEEGDEGGIFNLLAGMVDDPKLRRMVERHRDDEARHAQLFRGCLSRLDLELQPVPEELKIIPKVGARAGGLISSLDTIEGLVGIYALLLAIEERGIEQFPLIADAFRPFDAEIADVYLRVARDERGHVKYCETIGRHYAADEATWQRLVEHARELETVAFAEVTLADRDYCAERGWVARVAA